MSQTFRRIPLNIPQQRKRALTLTDPDGYGDLQCRLSSLDQGGLSGVRVSVVSSTFHPRRSYQENLWAEQLAELGAEVTVFSARSKRNQSVERRSDYQTNLNTPRGATYHHVELSSHVLPRNQFLTRNLGDALAENNPELIIWFGCIMYFGRAIYSDSRLSTIPVVTIYSLSRRGRHPFRWYGSDLSLGDRMRGLLFQTVRAPILTQSLKRAHLTVANTPECTDIIRQYVWGDERIQWARKHEEIPLGFCGNTFSYHDELRESARRALPIDRQDIVLVCSSRFEEDKWPALSSAFASVEGLLEALPSSKRGLVHALWVGARDNQTTHQFRQSLLERSSFQTQHHLFSFQSRQKLAMIYHAADIALFAQPSISCQEAIGTGLHILCPPDPSLNHLSEYTNRLAFAELIDWPKRLMSLCEILWEEQEVGMNEESKTPFTSPRKIAAQRASALTYARLVPKTLIALSRKLSG